MISKLSEFYCTRSYLLIAGIFLCVFFSITKVEAEDQDSLKSLLQQNIPDSVRASTLKKLARYSVDTGVDLKQGEEYAQKLLELGQKNNISAWIRDAWYLQGIFVKYKNQYQEATDLFLKVYRADSLVRDTFLMVAPILQLANIDRLKGDFTASMDKEVRALILSRAIADTSRIAFALNGKAILHKLMQQYDQALETYAEARSLYESSNDSSGLARVLYNTGNLHLKLGNYQKAIEYYELEEPISARAGNKLVLSYTHNSLGLCYGHLKDYPRARQYLQKSLSSRREVGDSTLIAESLIFLGKTENEMGNPHEAIQLISEGIDIAQKVKAKTQLKNGYQWMAWALEKAGMYQEAIRYERKFHKIVDSLLNSNISRQALEIEAIYESKEQEAAIAKLEFERELQQARTQRQKWFIIISLTAALALSVLLWRITRLKNNIAQQNKIISQALSDKETLLKEIHHRVKNNLQLISSLLSLQSYTIQDASALEALSEGQSRVQSMALIHQDLYRTDNLTGVGVEGYIKKLCQNLFNTYNISGDRIQLKLEIDPISLDVSTLIPMGLILNELISNSLKYAFPDDRTGTIGIILQEQNGKLRLEVWDDGKGYSDDARSDGFGHKLVNTFAKKLEADVKIDHHEGTVVSIDIANFKLAS